VMISYNWKHQDVIKKIHAFLVANKIKVWIDYEQMTGNIADKMAEAVEGSDAVIMCISSYYKESANCRQEAEYALECKKPLIILMMEKNYKANGWLGLMVGRKLWIDCTDPNAPDINGVIHEITSLGLTAGAGGGAPLPPPAASASPAPTPSVSAAPVFSGSVNLLGSKMSTMTNDDIIAWMKEAGVSPAIQASITKKKSTGEDLLGMVMTLRNYPGFVTMPDLMKDLGCTNTMEMFSFLIKLERLLVKKA